MFIKTYFKKRALRKYIFTLPKALGERYHCGPYYSEKQIETTIDQLNLSKRYIKYAFVMFCRPQERTAVLMRRYGLFSHDVFLQEIADYFYNGNTLFIIKEIDRSWKGGRCQGSGGYDGGYGSGLDG